MSRTYFKVEGGEVYHCKKIEKKSGGHFTTLTLKVNQGKDKITDAWKPNGFFNIAVYGELGDKIEIFPDKTKVTVEGYMVWDESKPEYRGWRYIATHIEYDVWEASQAASQKKAEDDSLPF